MLLLSSSGFWGVVLTMMSDEASKQRTFFLKKRIKVIGKWRIEDGHYISAPFYYRTVWFWQTE